MEGKSTRNEEEGKEEGEWEGGGGEVRRNEIRQRGASSENERIEGLFSMKNDIDFLPFDLSAGSERKGERREKKI